MKLSLRDLVNKIKGHPLKITEVHYMRAARGIKVEGVLDYPSRQKSTNAQVWFDHTSKGHSMILATWRFRQAAKRYVKQQRQTEGPYDLSPSSFIKGLLWT